MKLVAFMRLINVQTRASVSNLNSQMNSHFQDEQRLKELAGRLGLLENQHRQTMEVVFGLKNQVNKRQKRVQLVNLYISNYGKKLRLKIY